MNQRTTGLLALVAFFLGAFVYLYEIEGGSDREATREAEKELFVGVDAGAVESVELTTSDGSAARFERRDGAWRIAVPVEGAGDAMALDGVASALATLPRAGTVKAAPGDLAQFGLGPEAQTVRFTASGASHTLRIGRATPVGGNVYVAADGGGDDGEEVAYVESYRLNAFKQRLTDLRDRRVLALAADAVKRLEISWPEASGPFTLELERDAQDVWQLRRPIAARADRQTVRELLSNLEFLQATSFVDERTPAVEAALLETAIEIVFAGEVASDPDPVAGKLRIAGMLNGARIVESGAQLYQLPPERLDEFARRLSAYRDKQLVDLEPDSLAKIELEFAGGEAIVLVHAEAGWSAGEREIDSEAVAGLAAGLGELRAADIVADEMGDAELASLGLVPPAARVRLIAGSADAAEKSDGAVVLELGRLDPERGLFVRRTGDSTIFVLDASLAESLPLSAEAFDERYGKVPAESAAAESAPAEAAAPEAIESASPAGSDLLEQ